MKYFTKTITSTLAVLLASTLTLSAEDKPASSSSIEAQANNPLANFKALNFHNYYIGELTGPSDDTADQAWIRYAQPFSVGKTNWLLRASLAIETKTTPTASKHTGLGDLNVFAAYLMDVGNPAISFGFGPLVNLPTATDDDLGSGKYSAGFVNVLFDATSKVFQYGYLLTWQHSFAERYAGLTVNSGALQPFAMLQLGGGTYLRSVGIWTYNLENDDYAVPIGFGIGQVFKAKKTVFNLFIEPQYTVLHRGDGLAQWQVFAGLNMQFLGK